MSYGKRQSGQAAVETAIVMPLNIFLILAIIQFGLINQVRYMAKYAAYRAARVGSMNNANLKMMNAAAKATMLPVLAMPKVAGPGNETIQPTTNAAEIVTKLARLDLNNALSGGLDLVSVVICGPVSGDVTNITESKLGSSDSSNQVDFDDPRATMDTTAGFDATKDLKDFLATKLRVQVQVNYRMPIPFANWLISRAYLGMTMATEYRMGPDTNPFGPYAGHKLWVANMAKIYIAPIFENYAIRMQSNYFLKANPLPDSNQCISFAKANPNL